PRFSRTRWHDGYAVMQRHVVIGAVQVGLVAASAIHTGARVVWNNQLRGAQVVFEGRHMATHPVAQILTERGPRQSVLPSAQNGHEQRSRRDHTGSLIVDGNGVTGPVHEHLLAGAVLLTQYNILIPAPALIQFAEAAVAVAVRLGFSILLPDQLQGQMFVRLQ